ncbi:hypothetical protein [Streptomyces tauricus]|uniref:hypothetical protein n=1 Tax=Streptomyces tauricus TaxID=68274 RepID=UPI002244C1C6|nr:hypothetical protein [Streptomyces tauricus]MCW8097075.1 hypothetical protein [Streptomyces tauricus]
MLEMPAAFKRVIATASSPNGRPRFRRRLRNLPHLLTPDNALAGSTETNRPGASRPVEFFSVAEFGEFGET